MAYSFNYILSPSFMLQINRNHWADTLKKKLNICYSNNKKIGFSSAPAFIKDKLGPVIFITLTIKQTTH